jgi:hypothetical protein
MGPGRVINYVMQGKTISKSHGLENLVVDVVRDFIIYRTHEIIFNSM